MDKRKLALLLINEEICHKLSVDNILVNHGKTNLRTTKQIANLSLVRENIERGHSHVIDNYLNRHL